MKKRKKQFKPNIVPEWEYETACSTLTVVPLAAVKKYHTAPEYRRFCSFMAGQTQSLQGAYASDYRRWIESGMPAQQGKDWD